MPPVDAACAPPVVLSIAGSDSGGCAGIQADLRTFAALGVHGTTAITAVTAQNTLGVDGVEPLSADFVVRQVDSVLADLPVAAVKTGMLANQGIVEAVGHLASGGRLPHLVVDPVLVSTSGHALLTDGGVEAYRLALLPFAQVLTPNLTEAAVLCGKDADQVQSVGAMADLGRALIDLGAGVVLVKGGHLRRGPGGPPADNAPDVIVHAGGVSVLDCPRVATTNDHGTGCSLSAAIAAELARGAEPVQAIGRAKAFVGRALAGAAGWKLGAGHGPIDHLGWGPAT